MDGNTNRKDPARRSLLIWGAGDQGIVTLDCALAMGIYSRIDFLEIKEKGSREIPGHQVYREEGGNLAQLLQPYDEAIAATGSNGLREKKTLILQSFGMPLAAIVHPSAVISPSAAVSGGCMVLANAAIQANARIGIGCIVNTGAVVEHDCIVDDFVNICPHVSMGGHTKIGKGAYLGIACTMIDAIGIGENAVVGAGAVVIRDVPDAAVVAGVPARPIK